MALTHCKRLCILIHKNGQKPILSVMGNNTQHFLPVVYYSDHPKEMNKNLSRAMKAHLQRAVKYDQFLKEQIAEYEKGKEFLASMMGKKDRKMTQEEVDKAIEYLFPSKLYVPKARPLMKPPSEVFPPQKDAEFDYTGRPFHYLFYTTKKNFNEILHNGAKTLEALNVSATKRRHPPEPLIMAGKKWLTREELENVCKEKLTSFEYEKFLNICTKLAEHPFASEAESFLKNYWIQLEKLKEDSIILPVVRDDGVQVVTIENACRKTSIATVKLFHPGTGRIRINNTGLDYFFDISSREQVIFPLIYANMLDKVDVEATVEGGGYSSQAGAVRFGIAQALLAFVSPDMALDMKLSGLLQRDFRKRERKKPGKEGARRSYTWLKR